MYPHRIRLLGPWECQPLARLVRLPDGRVETQSIAIHNKLRMKMPCRWREGGLGPFTGRVLFRRHFGFPGNVDASERIWLTFAGVEGTAEAAVNGVFLGRWAGSEGPAEFDVSRLLQMGNDLKVLVESLSEEGGLWGEVALEIRATAFLRGVRARL